MADGVSHNGGAGTIYLKAEGAEFGDLVVDNANRATSGWSTSLFAGTDTGAVELATVTLWGRARLHVDSLTTTEVVVGSNALLDCTELAALERIDLDTGGGLIVGGDVTGEVLEIDGAGHLTAGGDVTVDVLVLDGVGRLTAGGDVLVVVGDGSGSEDVFTFGGYLTANSLSFGVGITQLDWSTGDGGLWLAEGLPANFDVVVDGATCVLDGTYVLNSLSVLNGGVLTHSGATVSGESRLELEVGTLVVDATSAIDVSGRGYLGGRREGLGEYGRTLGNEDGSQGQSGGGYGALGGQPSSGYVRNDTYGDFTDPDELGSGGGGRDYYGARLGGSGGGLVRITAGAMTLDGVVRADGMSGSWYAGSGSGGGIRLDVGVLSGGGQISAVSGSFTSNYSGGGGGGRVAVYFGELSGFDPERIYAYGGLGAVGHNGGAGTIYLESDDYPYAVFSDTGDVLAEELWGE